MRGCACWKGPVRWPTETSDSGVGNDGGRGQARIGVRHVSFGRVLLVGLSVVVYCILSLARTAATDYGIAPPGSCTHAFWVQEGAGGGGKMESAQSAAGYLLVGR